MAGRDYRTLTQEGQPAQGAEGTPPAAMGRQGRHADRNALLAGEQIQFANSPAHSLTAEQVDRAMANGMVAPTRRWTGAPDIETQVAQAEERAPPKPPAAEPPQVGGVIAEAKKLQEAEGLKVLREGVAEALARQRAEIARYGLRAGQHSGYDLTQLPHQKVDRGEVLWSGRYEDSKVGHRHIGASIQRELERAREQQLAAAQDAALRAEALNKVGSNFAKPMTRPLRPQVNRGLLARLGFGR